MLILHNARIRTLNPRQPFVSALAIENGRILAAGSDEDVLALVVPGAKIENLHGQTVWPGLTDAHLHLEHYAFSLERIDCEVETREECLRRVAERASGLPAGNWILGHGFDQNRWQGGYGSAAELDLAAGGRPAYLTAKSLHAAWASSAALRLAGIDRATPDPEGGIIQRDADGEPTGILLENAVRLVEAVLPVPDEHDTAGAIEHALTRLWRMGITGVHDFDRRRCFQALQILDSTARLNLRVVKGIPVDQLSEAVALGLRTGFGSDFLRIGSVKMFADGALGPQTAAMLQPYEHSEGAGVLQLNAEQVFEAGRQAAQSGLSLAVHAIGDRANHEILNGYALLRRFESQNNLPRLRHRIEHVQLLHPDDLTRLAELDVIASVQPVHAISDIDIANRHWGSRSRYAYAYKSLLDANTRLAFGSDAPVETPNPFLGLHAAVNRARPSGYPGREGWHPEQRLSLEQALAGFTTGPAFAAGLEDRLGRLQPGYFADLIVLDGDPFALPLENLHQYAPAATMVAGQWVWRH